METGDGQAMQRPVKEGGINKGTVTGTLSDGRWGVGGRDGASGEKNVLTGGASASAAHQHQDWKTHP